MELREKREKIQEKRGRKRAAGQQPLRRLLEDTGQDRSSNPRVDLAGRGRGKKKVMAGKKRGKKRMVRAAGDFSAVSIITSPSEWPAAAATR